MTDSVNELKKISIKTLESLILDGDLSQLSSSQRIEYYKCRCDQVGLDPSAKPFELIKLNGKVVLYATAACSQQLTAKHKLSHAIMDRCTTDGIYCVSCRVTGPDGRTTENIGAVPLDTLKGEARANAIMKGTTKAIRRSVLAHMGLGMLDETEVDTIPGAVKVSDSPKSVPIHAVIIDAEPSCTDLEWSDEDKKSSKELLMDACELMLENGVPSEVVKEKSCAAASKIGDVELTPSRWANRLSATTERVITKYKKEASNDDTE